MKKEPKATTTLRAIDWIILLAILILAFSLRFYKLDTPLADYHSWRQVDTAAVARNFVRDGFDLMHPKYDDLSSLQTGLENPNGYRFVEFPIYNSIFAALYKTFPMIPLEVWGRLTTAFFSLIIIGIIYYLSIKEANKIVAVFASLTYAAFPFFVYFSRVILPETTAVAFSMLSILFLYKSVTEKGGKNVLLILFSAVSFAAAILVKPTVIFYTIVILYILYRKYSYRMLTKFATYIYFLLSAIPFIAWRYYISQYPEGIPANSWLITSVNTYEGLKTIFLRPAFFRWIFFERINNFIFGGYLTVFFLLGIFAKTRTYLLHTILLAAAIYIFTFQGGNVQHEYYQTIAFPALALMVGLGVSFIVTNIRLFITPFITYPLILFIFVFSFGMSYYKVKDYYSYPPEFPVIARIVQSLTDKNDKIVTDRLGDTTLLYLLDRKGSPALYKDLEEFKKQGYAYFITTNKETAEKTKSEKGYRVIFENDKFALFKL